MGRRVLVTGSETFFGRALLLALEADETVERVVALDFKAPGRDLEKAVWHRLDLVHPRSGELLAELIEKYALDTLVHTAFLARPVHKGGWAHELEAIGTRHVLSAAEATGVGKVVLRSTTLTYGATANHPNFLPESAPLDGQGQSAFLADKVEVERQASRFAQAHPEKVVTVLRFAPLLGPSADTIATLYFQRALCPTLLGYDPLVQLLHEEDAVEATRLALHRDVRGPVNIGAPEVLALSQAIRLAGARALPLPGPWVRSFSQTLWAVQWGAFPPGLVDFLKYLCVGDLKRMHDELGLSPKYGIRDAILSFAGSTRLGRAAA